MMMNSEATRIQRQNTVLTPDISRVLLKKFEPVKLSFSASTGRIEAIVARIASLPEDQARADLDRVVREFRDRHRDLEKIFDRRFEEVKSFLPAGAKPSSTVRRLIGSYFVCEYSLEAAALFNPSIVAHPDQAGVPAGSLRFIMSLRATGEGHISSIEFRTGLISAAGVATLDPVSRFVSGAMVTADPAYVKAELVAKLEDNHALTVTNKSILRGLPPTFNRNVLLAKIARFRKSQKRPSAAQARSVKAIEELTELNYELSYSSDHPLSERVIFPLSSFESNGIEDARFVRFADDRSAVTYYATYTAYNGIAIRPLMLETSDFLRFRVRSLSGEAAKNKGMALFPRKIGGKYAMISRHDGENLFIGFSESPYRWRTYKQLFQPSASWEFTQIGNCGSPVETDRGWILLTHGVGPVRKYSIGALLLDREDPSRVIGKLTEPLISPDESEREGYVPNVVYTCGSLAHNGNLIIPYAVSDHATRFASISVNELLSRLK